MKQKRWLILLAILALVISSLACGLVSGGQETAPEVAPTTEPTESTSSDNPIEEVPAEEEPTDQMPAEESGDPGPPPNVDLDDEYRSEEGGYAFQPIPGYELEEFFVSLAIFSSSSAIRFSSSSHLEHSPCVFFATMLAMNIKTARITLDQFRIRERVRRSFQHHWPPLPPS